MRQKIVLRVPGDEAEEGLPREKIFVPFAQQGSTRRVDLEDARRLIDEHAADGHAIKKLFRHLYAGVLCDA